MTNRLSLFDNCIDHRNQLADPFLSPKDAAKYLGVSVRLIYERIARREIETQPVGRLKRIRLSALETWLLQQREGRMS